MDKLNIGILGLASIATRSVIPAIQSLPGIFRVTAVASRRNKDKVNETLSDQVRICDSYKTLIDDNEVVAVYIPLPNSMHYEWVKKALESNKHVMVEKPLACSYEEVLELTKIAKKNKRVLLEHFQFRFHHQMEAIRKLLSDGTIGELRNMRASFGFPPFSDENNIRYQNKLGGGALLDAGSYMMKVTALILGSDIEVSAARLFIDPVKKVDTWGSGMIQQKTGQVSCQFAFGFDHYYQCGIELWGSKGKITTNRLFTARSDHHPEIFVETMRGKECIKLKPDDHFRNFLIHFHRLITEFPVDEIETEHQNNILQVSLLDSFKKLANTDS